MKRYKDLFLFNMSVSLGVALGLSAIVHNDLILLFCIGWGAFFAFATITAAEQEGSE